MLCADQYKEILLTEDEDLLGIRFRQPIGVTSSFEIDSSIDKHDGFFEDSVTLASRMIHSRRLVVRKRTGKASSHASQCHFSRTSPVRSYRDSLTEPVRPSYTIVKF